MKKLLTLLTLLTIALSTFAQEFTVGDLTYAVLSTDDKTAKVTDGKNATGDVVVPETVMNGEIEYRITAIGDAAFRSNTSIVSVSLPAVTSIGSYAFYGCSSLTSVSLPVATSIGSNAFYYCSALASISLPAATSIDERAFYECSSLSSISLPVATSIGNYAFTDCTSLTTVNIPAATSLGKWSFDGAKSLVNLELPEVTSIGECALSGMNNLRYLSIPKVETIDNSAFTNGTYYIQSIRIGSIEQYCNISYGNDMSLPFNNASGKYTSIYIGDSETPATEITIPANVTQIPDYAFRSTKIHTIHFAGTTPPALVNRFYNINNTIPEWTMLAVPDAAYETYLAADGYKTIPLQITKEGDLTQNVNVEAVNGSSSLLAKLGEEKVRNVVNLKVTGTINSYDMLIIRNQMPSLRNLDLTNASTVDCDYIYSTAGKENYHSVKDEITGDWLKNVMNIKLPLTTKVIGHRAFYECGKLLSIDIPSGVTSIGDYAFRDCKKLENINIPEGVTSIGDEAFYLCRAIQELSLPESVRTFGNYAFYDCTGLREVVIPNGVTSIGSNAFARCTDLETVTIPASVTEIGDFAFCTVGHSYTVHTGVGSSRTEYGPLTLRISSINDWINIKFNQYAFDNVGKLYIGESDEPVENITIPTGTTELKKGTFYGFKCMRSISLPEGLTSIDAYTFFRCNALSEITFPESLKSIGYQSFYDCDNLERITFADGIENIGSYAFQNCSKLTKIELPAYLKTIGIHAFDNCTELTEVLIPASITQVGDYAFLNCSKLNRVIVTTVEPISINQNTFSTYQTATLYSPKTSFNKYYWNAQYNQFLARKEYDKEFAKTFGYKYFYLNGENGGNKEDFQISDETGVINGVGEDKPDADFNEGAGMIVGGEQVQELGDIHIHHNGNNGASVITKNSGKVHINNLYVDIKVQKNRWYFFCFPFDIQPSQASFDGSHVWYLYDGEARALNGNGGWKKVASDGVMKSGNGYIFQGAVNGTLTIHVQDVTIDGSDTKTNMITYQSDNKNDASWNLIGNPNIAYYDVDNLGYEAPVTVYNNETGNYEAVRPGDDQYEFYPFQAFFVQKPADKETMDFDASKKETKNMADQSSAAKAAAKAKSQAKANSPRKVINLELASVDTDEKATDRTRIVVNPMKTTDYETDCDAAKFIADNLPQIYSLDNAGCMYAINERPVENGIIDIVVKVTKEGVFSISAPRLDCAAKLRDIETGTEVDLAEGAYTFMAEASTYTDRFKLILANGTTDITTPEEAQAAISVEAGVININDTNADVKVYSVGGSLVKAQKGAGTINVPAGTYVVNVNGQSVKVNVNE